MPTILEDLSQTVPYQHRVALHEETPKGLLGPRNGSLANSVSTATHGAHNSGHEGLKPKFVKRKMDPFNSEV